MLHTIFGTAHFPVIADAQDFSCALFDARGLMVAQGRDMPGHVAAMPASVAEILVDFGPSMAPGDVYIVNDPYRGGSHLNDVTLISPVFFDDTLFLFPCVCMHWGDIGGMTPGTASGEATEILQGAGVPADQAGRARPTQPDRLRHSVCERPDGRRAPRRPRRLHHGLPHRRAPAARDGRALPARAGPPVRRGEYGPHRAAGARPDPGAAC